MMGLIIIALIFAFVGGVLVFEGIDGDYGPGYVILGIVVFALSLVVGFGAYDVHWSELENMELKEFPPYDVKVETTITPDGKEVSDTTYVFHIDREIVK